MSEWDSAPIIGESGEAQAPAAPWEAAPILGAPVKAKAAIGATANPEESAKILNFSKKNNVPVEALETDFPEFEQKQKVIDSQQAVTDNPHIAKYVNENPSAAKVSNDDWGPLGKVSDLFSKAFGLNLSWEQPPNLMLTKDSLDPWTARFPQGWEFLTTPEGRKNLFNTLDYLPITMLKGFLEHVAPVPGEAFEKGITRDQEIEFATNMALLLEGQKIGLPKKGKYSVSTPADIKIEGPLKRGVSPEVGAFLGTKEGLKTRQEIDDFIKARETKEAPPESPELKLLPAPKEFEYMEGGELKTTKAPEPRPEINPVAAAMARQGEIPHVGMEPVVDKMLAEQTKNDAGQFNQVFAAVQEAATKERSPELMEKYLDGVVGDRQVSIPAEEALKLYGNTVPAVDDKLLGFVPDMARQLEVARETGSEVSVPMAQYLAHVDPAVHQRLAENLRFREKGLTPLEGKAIEEAQKQAAKDAADTDLMNEEFTKFLAENAPKEVPVEGALPKAGEDLAPQAETIKSKPGANTARLARLLGPKLYGEPKGMAAVTVKELLQNAFDAVKGHIEKGIIKEGKIDILMSEESRTISVRDNGSGMTPEVLGKQFLEIAGTNKETERASGGLGIAKMMTLFGNKEITVVSARDGRVSTLKSSGPELFAAMEDPALAPDITIKNMTPAMKEIFPDGHGTFVEIKVPKDYKDPSTGETKTIDFNNSKVTHDVIKKSPLFSPIEVTWNGAPISNIGKHFPANDFTQFANVNFDWGTARIYVGKKELVPGGGNFARNMHVLSNGLWQFTGEIKADPLKAFGENVNREFYVDVEPKALPDEPGYPFDLNRQQFSAQAKSDFGKIFNYISQRYQQDAFSKSAQNFGHIEYLRRDAEAPGLPKITSSGPIELRPKVPERKTAVNQISEGDQVEVVDGKLIVNGRKIPELTPQDLEDAKINLDELKMPQSEIDPNTVMLHDNVEVAEGGAKEKYVSLVDLARQKFGPAFDSYVFEIGNAFKDLRDVTAEVMKYPELKTEGIGVSFDPDYRGVSIRVPFHASFINPAGPVYTDPIRAGVGIAGTMLHELAHHVVRSHDAEFSAEMQHIQINLDAFQIAVEERMIASGFDFHAFKKRIVEIQRNHADVFTFLNKQVLGSDARPRGQRFKNASEYETRDASVPRDQEISPSEGGGTGGLPESVRPLAQSIKGEQGHPGVSPKTSNDPIAVEKASLYLHPLFKDAKAAGVTEPEFKRYSKKIEERDNADSKRLAEVSIRAAKRKLTPDWKKNEAEVRTEVETDLRNRPDIIADRFLRLGDLPTGERVAKVQLDKEAVEAIAGKGALADFTKEGGVSPDEVAAFLGFDTGADMVHALDLLDGARKAAKETPKAYFDRVVKQQTAFRMEGEYGNLEKAILDEAREAALASDNAEILIDELRMLATQAGGKPPLSRDQIKAWVLDQFANTPIKQAANYEGYRRATERAGREAEKALLKGDAKGAFQEKQKQVLSFLSAKEAKAFAKKQATALRLFDKFADELVNPKVSQEYTDQIQGLLKQVGYDVKRSDQSLEKTVQGKSLDAFINEKLADGRVMIRPDLPRKNSYNEFTVDEFLGLNDVVRNLDHNGRDEKTIEVGEKRETYEAAVGGAITNLEKMVGDFDPRKRSAVKTVMSYLVKMEQLFDWADRRDPDGPFNRIVFRPLSAAKHWKTDKIREISAELEKLPGDFSWRKGLRDMVPNTVLIDPRNEKPMAINREAMIAMALNSGSKSNFDVLTGGYGWDPKEVRAFLDTNMTKQDWEVTQGFWDLFEKTMAKDIERVTESLSGVPVDMVEPQSFDTQHGKIKGGYFPLIADPLAQLENNARKVELDAPQYAPLPSPRATKRRTGAVYPLSLEIHGIPGRINETVHNLAYREALLNAKKLLDDPLVRQAFTNTFGQEYTALLTPWLQHIAQDGVSDNAGALAQYSRFFRMNAQGMAIGLNPGTIAIHGGAAGMNSIGEVGVMPFIRASSGQLKDMINKRIGQFVGNPVAAQTMTEEAYAQSGEIRNRKHYIDDSINQMVDRVFRHSGLLEGGAEAIKGNMSLADAKDLLKDARMRWLMFSMSGVSHFDQLTAVPTWIAARDHAMLQGKDLPDAIYEADKAMRNAHGANGLIDTARVQRIGEFPKWFTMFYGFMNHYLNRLWDAQRVAKGQVPPPQGSSKASWTFNRLMTYMIAGAILHEAIRGHGDENEGWGKWAVKALTGQIAGMFPGVRDIQFGVVSGQKANATPLSDTWNAYSTIFTDVAKAVKASQGPVSKQWVEHMMNVPGYSLGFGTRQTSRATQFLTDLYSHNQRADTGAEYLRGLITGHAQKRHR